MSVILARGIVPVGAVVLYKGLYTHEHEITNETSNDKSAQR